MQLFKTIDIFTRSGRVEFIRPVFNGTNTCWM